MLIISFEKVFCQNCVLLGCAANYGTQTGDGTLPDSAGTLLGGCYDPFTYKQVFWEFFYSPTGGNFTQTYTPVINGGDSLDLDYMVYDMGVSVPPPNSIPCPIDPSPWTILICNNFGGFDDPTGPGVTGSNNGNVCTTTAGHYYAVAIILWQGISKQGDPSYPFTVSTPQLGGLDLTPANCPGILPVILSSFNASINYCNINLDWVASETNFKIFEVQYSTDGIKFQTIATIAGVEGATKKFTYQHTNPQQGTIYYRLKMIDIDGKFSYSEIIALNLNCNRSSIMVYPNPVTDILNVNINSSGSDVTVADLFDANGKQVYSGEMINGTNMIDMKKFAKGVYFLRLKNNIETQNIKIIK